MRFYAEADGYELLFSTNDLVKAIYTAWNYNGDLWIIPSKTRVKDIKDLSVFANHMAKLIFSSGDPLCSDLSEYNLEICESDENVSYDMYIKNTRTGKIYLFDEVEKLELKYS